MNKKFYIIAGIVLALALAAVVVLSPSPSTNQPAPVEDQGLRINP